VIGGRPPAVIGGSPVSQAIEQLRQAFPQGVEEGASLAPHTAARLGGPAEVLLTVRSGEELQRAAQLIWSLDLPLRILGGGSNVLVADAGVKGVVVLNQAKAVRFEEPGVWAESGAFFGSTARRCVEHGLAGLEWAATVPGTIGGAVVGNAGAHGGEVADALVSADLLTREQGVELDWVTWRGFYVPGGISEAAYGRWVDALTRVAASPAWTTARDRYGLEPFFLTGDEFRIAVEHQVEDFRTMSREIGLLK